MPIGLIFWVIMLLWIISAIGRHYGGPNYPWAPAYDVIILILFFLLGWHDFGFIVHP
jgi:hypothetical protein